MQVRLEVAHQKANVKRVVLRQDATIGRSSECSLRIASSLVSRQHCKFTITDDSVLVRDLGSSNGTFVNGQRLEPQQDYEIAPDSQLSVGGVMFFVRFTPPAPQPLVGQPPGSTVDLPVVQPDRPISSDQTAEWSPDAVERVSARGTATAGSASPGSVPHSGLAETATFSGLPPAEAAVLTPALAQVAAVANRPPAGLGDSAVEGLGTTLPVDEGRDVDADSATISATPEQIAAALASVGVAVPRHPGAPPVADAAPEVVESGDVEDDTLGDHTGPVGAADEPLGEIPSVDEHPVMVGAEAIERDAIDVSAGDVFDAGAASPAEAGGWPGVVEFATAPADTVDDSIGIASVEAESEAEPGATGPHSGADARSSQRKPGRLASFFGLFRRKEKPSVPAAHAPSPEVAGDDTPPLAIDASAGDVLPDGVLPEDAVADGAAWDPGFPPPGVAVEPAAPVTAYPMEASSWEVAPVEAVAREAYPHAAVAVSEAVPVAIPVANPYDPPGDEWTAPAAVATALAATSPGDADSPPDSPVDIPAPPHAEPNVEPAAVPVSASESPPDDGFGDFLRQIGQ